MKNAFATAILIFIAFTTTAQHVTYSRNNVSKRYVDFLQLVSNISNTNHLLVVSHQNKVVINIFNSLLERVSIVETPIKIAPEATINVITTKDEYFLFTNVNNTRTNGLWRINAKGDVEDLIVPYTTMLDSLFPKSKGTLRMTAENNQLFFLSHINYPRLRQIVTTQVRVDNKMNILETRKVAYEFGRSTETLHQVHLMDANNLLVLKTAADSILNRTLQLVKVNFVTGVTEIATYKTGTNALRSPRIHTTATDSTIIIYGGIGSNIQNDIFFGKVNKSFTEVGDAGILKRSIYNNYILINDVKPKWVTFSSNRTSNRITYNTGNNEAAQYADRIIRDRQFYSSFPPSSSISSFNYNPPPTVPFNYTTTPTFNSSPYQYSNSASAIFSPIKLWVVNSHFKPVADSILSNKSEKHIVITNEYANFSINNKNFLILKQLFKKAKGLVVFYADDKEKVQSTNILANTKYEYFLDQAQQVANNAILIPFAHKQEAGIIKVTIDDNIRY